MSHNITSQCTSRLNLVRNLLRIGKWALAPLDLQALGNEFCFSTRQQQLINAIEQSTEPSEFHRSFNDRNSSVLSESD